MVYCMGQICEILITQMNLTTENSFVLTDVLVSGLTPSNSHLLKLHLCEYHIRVDHYKTNTKKLILILDSLNL